MLQAVGSRVRVPMKQFKLFNVPNLSSRTMSLGFTQPLTELSPRRYSGGKARSAIHMKGEMKTKFWFYIL
jgi:hypothetical protein